MTDQTPKTTETPPPTGPSAPETPVPGQSGGVSINSGGGAVDIGGHVAGHDLNINNPGGSAADVQPKPAGARAVEATAKSSWANGLFYLFAFVVIVGVIGFFAQKLDLLTLALIVVAGIIAVPVIGAFQLKMDKRLSDKTFTSLMKMVLAQLPLIGGMVKK